MYNLKKSGYHIEQFKSLDPDPLATLGYSCLYWIDHLCKSNENSSLNQKPDIEAGALVDTFVKTK